MYNNPLSEAGAEGPAETAAPVAPPEGLDSTGSMPLLKDGLGHLSSATHKWAPAGGAWGQHSELAVADDRIAAFHGYGDQGYLQVRARCDISGLDGSPTAPLQPDPSSGGAYLQQHTGCAALLQ